MTFDEAVREIIIRAPSISHEAMKLLHLNADNPARQIRYNHVALNALRDPEAKLTDEERDQILALCVPTEETRTETLPPVRLTPSERVKLEIQARQAGMSLSEYIRRNLWREKNEMTNYTYKCGRCGTVLHSREEIKSDPGTEEGWEEWQEAIDAHEQKCLDAHDVSLHNN